MFGVLLFLNVSSLHNPTTTCTPDQIPVWAKQNVIHEEEVLALALTEIIFISSMIMIDTMLTQTTTTSRTR